MTVLLDKVYHGFEDAVDIERDISEMFQSPAAECIPPEWQGVIHVVVTYVPEPSEG